MNPRRAVLAELLALGISVAVLVSQFPDARLVLQRYAMQALQGVARAAGTAALKLEANYKIRIAP